MLANRRVIICILTSFLVLFESLYLIIIVTRQPVVREKLPGDNITDFVPPFVPLLNEYVIAAGYGLLGCSIRKTMSQLNYNLLCYLNNTKGFIERNQSLSDVWYDDRMSCPYISSYENPQDDSAMEQLTKFAFIRDPEERFVSFFVDKCLKENSCYNCTDVRCASKLIYDRLISMASNQSSFTKNDGQLWFEWHVAPQTWNCDFYKYLNDYHLVPIGTSHRDRKNAMKKMRKVLRLAGVEKVHIEKIVEDTVGGETKHATHGSRETTKILEEVRNDPYVLHYLHRIYYFDYIAFGFKLPEFFSFQDFGSFNKTRQN